MSRIIQLRIPDRLHRSLKSHAAEAGMSLPAYLLGEMRRLAEAPTMGQFRKRLASREPVQLQVSSAQLIREQRGDI